MATLQLITPSQDLCAPEYVVRSFDRYTGKLKGYLAVWGRINQRDCYNTWFDRSNPPELGLEYLPIPLFYQHGQDRKIGKTPIGTVTRTWVDNVGIGDEADLDKQGKHYSRVVDEIERGELATSSGSSQHLAEFDRDGRFIKWFLSEISLTPDPCEPRMPKVSLRSKSLSGGSIAVRDEAGEVPFAEPGANEPDPSIEPLSNPALMEGDTTMTTPLAVPTTVRDGMMPPEGADPAAQLAQLVQAMGGVEQVMALLQQMAAPAEVAPAALSTPAATTPAPAAPAAPATVPAQPAIIPPGTPAAVPATAPVEQRNQPMFNQQQMMSLLLSVMNQPGNNPGGQATPPALRDRQAPAVISEYSRAYDHLSTDDMVFAATVFDTLHNDGRMRRPASEKFIRSLNTRFAHEVQSNNQAFIRNMPPSIRANELMGSTVVGAGDEWVGIQYDNRLWNKIRQNTIYQELISKGLVEREVPQGYESIKVLTEGADPTWYAVGATVSEDATGQPQTKLNSSKPGTGQQDLSVAKLGAAVIIQTELEEDSLIAVMPQLRDMMDKSGQEQIEYILINGDTDVSASTNINLIDSTPAAASLGGLPSYTLLNGFLKLALVTNTANARDGGVLDEDDYMETLKLMGTNGKDAIEPDRCVFIVDNMTYYKTLQLAVVKTQDVFSGATIVNGQLQGMWGRRILVSGQMALANTAGKISNTAGNNTKGRILSIRPDRWTLGWKRRSTTEVQRWSRADATELVTYLRMGLAYFNSEASAVSYNMTV